MDPIVLSDGFGGIVDTHGIIRGILITGNPTKHPYHPPAPSLYVAHPLDGISSRNSSLLRFSYRGYTICR